MSVVQRCSRVRLRAFQIYFCFAAGILSLFFLVTVIATLVMVADDTSSTDASSVPAACAPWLRPSSSRGTS